MVAWARMRPSVRRLVALVVLSGLVLPTWIAPREAHAQLSETERKAAARAAYTEGLALEEAGKHAEALARFEAAQKLFDAPTHLLHIAQCQAKVGKLVESAETYEILTRKTLGPDASEAFVRAQEAGREEGPAVRARIPTLRLTVKPDPTQLANLRVVVNGAAIPNELLGISRPINPGTYRLSATADGAATPAPIDVQLREKDARAVDLILVRSAAPAPIVVVPPGVTPAAQPPPATGPAPAPAPYEPAPSPKPTGVSSTGLLVGLHTGLFIPGGKVYEGVGWKNVADMGPGIGLDVSLRLARTVLLGGTYEYASLGQPNNVTVNPSTSYLGVVLGFISSPDKVAFTADLGMGKRWATAEVTTAEAKADSLDFQLGVGVVIPAGPLRLVPKASLSFGSYGSRDPDLCARAENPAACDIPLFDASLHSVIFLGMGALWHFDLGKKN